MSGRWTETEMDAIRRGVEGEIDLKEMFDLLPRRQCKHIRIKFANYGMPSEEVHYARSCLVGCYGLARATAATGKHFT